MFNGFSQGLAARKQNDSNVIYTRYLQYSQRRAPRLWLRVKALVPQVTVTNRSTRAFRVRELFLCLSAFSTLVLEKSNQSSRLTELKQNPCVCSQHIWAGKGLWEWDKLLKVYRKLSLPTPPEVWSVRDNNFHFGETYFGLALYRCHHNGLMS